MIDTVYLVIAKQRYYRPVVKRATRRAPKLKQGEVALRIELDIPMDVFNPPATSLMVRQENIIRPQINVSQP